LLVAPIAHIRRTRAAIAASGGSDHPRRPRQLRQPQTPQVRGWLERHPRFVFHYTPKSVSWLNAVEGFFAKLSERNEACIAYTQGERATMVFDKECRITRDPDRDARLLWTRLVKG